MVACCYHELAANRAACKRRLLMCLKLRHLINVDEVTRMDLGTLQKGAKAALCSHPPARACSTIRPDPSFSECLHGMVT